METAVLTVADALKLHHKHPVAESRHIRCRLHYQQIAFRRRMWVGRMWLPLPENRKTISISDSGSVRGSGPRLESAESGYSADRLPTGPYGWIGRRIEVACADSGDIRRCGNIRRTQIVGDCVFLRLGERLCFPFHSAGLKCGENGGSHHLVESFRFWRSHVIIRAMTARALLVKRATPSGAGRGCRCEQPSSRIPAPRYNKKIPKRFRLHGL